MSMEKTLDAIERRGIEIGKEEIVRRMIAEGLDTSFIARLTGVSEGKIEQLRQTAKE